MVLNNMKKLLITPEGEFEIELTSEEIAQRKIDEQNAIEQKELLEQKIQNQENKKASGKQKLKDLGLDDDEIQALMGE
tara:strand:+ start:610 stop:843 length:234 start_codon:yes stop_codon:yes gene_type:complete